MSAQDSWGPTVRGGRARVGRRLLRLLVLLLVVALAGAALLGAWLTTRIPREPVEGLAGSSQPMHVLVTGSDRREDLTREQQQELGVGSAGGERTDTIFVMTIQGGDVALLAFPRDLWVTRCDGSTGRINVAIQHSPGCLVRTVRDLSGIDVQHLVRITFDGFVDVVDAVGGVELCLEDPIEDADAHIDLPAGCQELNGRDALGYVRVRKIDDDLGRIDRQQEFLQSLAREAASPATLLNPLRAYRLGTEAGDAVTVDDAMGPIDLFRLARGLQGMASGEVAAHTVPGIPQRRGDAAVLLPDEAPAEQLFSRFRDGSILREARSGVAPSDVRVSVYNAAGIGGLAGQVAELLEARGYEIAEIGNAEPRERTLLRHPPGERSAAEAVAADVPGDVEIEESSEVTHPTLLLGPAAGGR